jgi:hypothetical protein
MKATERGSLSWPKLFCLRATLFDLFVFKPSQSLTGAFLIGCLFGQSKCLQSFRFFTNYSAVGLIFHHSLCTFFGTLFLSETRFGTGSGLIRLRFQCRLPFAILRPLIYVQS